MSFNSEDYDVIKKKLLVSCLSKIGDILGDRCCNDVGCLDEAGFTVDELNQMAVDMHYYNGDPEVYEEGEILDDHSFLFLFSKYIENDIQLTPAQLYVLGNLISEV